MKKVTLFVCALLAVLLFGCSSSSDDGDDDLPAPAVSESKTQVCFSNSSGLSAEIYADATKKSLLASVENGESATFESEYIKTGSVFYFSYYLEVGEVRLLYGSGESILTLKENKTISANIPEPSTVFNNAAVILLENLSNNAISVKSGTTELIPSNYESSLVNPNETAAYVVSANSISGISNYQIVEALTTTALIDSTMEIKARNIYTIKYQDRKSALFSVSSFDLSLQKQIWKLVSSTTTGKTLRVGYIMPRADISNGYLLYGRLCYNSDTDTIQGQPFFSSIDVNGNLTDEKRLYLKDNPDVIFFKSGAEINGKLLSVASAKWKESDYVDHAVLLGQENVSIYKDIGVEEYYSNCPVHLIAQDENTFYALLEVAETEDSPSAIVLRKITTNGNTVTDIKSVWTLKDESADYIPQSFAYDSDDGLFGILAQVGTNGTGEKSRVCVIDTEGTEKGTIEFEDYTFNKIIYDADSNSFFASGAYVSPVSGKDEAAFVKISPITAKTLWSPRTYAASGNRNANFNDISVNGSEILLAGYTDCTIQFVNGDIEKSGSYPFLVSYNTKTDAENWSQVYKSYENFEIYSCFRSNIDTPFVELWNSESSESFICSTDLLGNIPKTLLGVIPDSSLSASVVAPDCTITFYDSDENEYSFEAQYGSTLTAAIVNSHISEGFASPEGKTLSNWSYTVENTDGGTFEQELGAYPVLVTGNLALRPKYKIAAPSGLYASEIGDFDITLRWDENPSAAGYYVYASRDEDFTNPTVLVTNENEYKWEWIADSDNNTVAIQPGTTYYFRVQAYDSTYMPSELSQSISVTTTIPDCTLALYDSNGTEFDVSFPYGSTVTLENTADYISSWGNSFTVTDGKEIIAWVLDGTEVSFPLTVNALRVELYPIFKISAPDFYVTDITTSSITVAWMKNAAASQYQLEISDNNFYGRYTYKTALSTDSSVKWTSLYIDDSSQASLSAGNTYYLRIKAYDASADEWSDYSPVITVTMPVS